MNQIPNVRSEPNTMDSQDKRRKEEATEQISARHVTIVKARNKRIALIFVSMCILLMLFATVYTAMVVFSQQPVEDGVILDNVIIGGVNIGGMTREEAENVVRLTIEAPLTTKNMVARLEYDALTISPADIGLTLDVEGLIDAAYRYGRTGSKANQALVQAQAKSREYHIALLPYMQLDLNAIYGSVKEFCSGYRISLTQPTVELVGQRPVYSENAGSVEHQVMVITMGTPQANLTVDDLYGRILDGYSLLQLEIYYDPPVVVEPDKPDAQTIFSSYCQAPQDATIDSKTFAVTPEVYGYGYDIASVQRLIDRATYGQRIEIPLGFLMPDITAEALAGHLFKDTLATYTSICEDSYNANRNKNLRVACEKIDGYVIKVGESFDFNALFGSLSTVQGFASAPTYSNSNTSTVGGGISQVASALHYCAQLSGLQIDERHPHRYAVTYTPLGTDAAISYGTENLVFTNTTSAPIRILAVADGSTVTITLLGTKSNSYHVTIEYEILATYEPHTTYQLMAKDNVFGYKDGDVTQVGIFGYDLQMYRCHYSATTGFLVYKEPLETVTYSSRDETVVQIGTEEDIGGGV